MQNQKLTEMKYLLTNANGAIFSVAAITIASETKKHIAVGLHLVMNMEIAWIKMNKTCSV